MMPFANAEFGSWIEAVSQKGRFSGRIFDLFIGGVGPKRPRGRLVLIYRMARPLRIEYDGALYHVTSRGNERKAIFKHDSDRKLFLDMLAQVNKRFHWICHAYCLMDNHYHLIIECSISLKGPTGFQGRGPLRSAERSDEGREKGSGVFSGTSKRTEEQSGNGDYKTSTLLVRPVRNRTERSQ